jgi:hypothetical protein
VTKRPPTSAASDRAIAEQLDEIVGGGAPPPRPVSPRFARLLCKLYAHWQEDPTKWTSPAKE